MKYLLATTLLFLLGGCTVQMKSDKKLDKEKVIFSEYELYFGPKIGKV